MPRKRSRDGDEDPEASQPPASQAASQATQAPPLEAAELEKLSATAVRFVLMREHSRKPLARTELKEAVLGKDRTDRGGKIIKAVIAAANEKLRHLCGLELATANSAADAAPDASQAAGPSQAEATQEATQERAVGGGAASKLLLVNVLPRAVAPEPADGRLVFYALVETVLNLLSDHGGRLPESELTETWLPKLGLKEKDTLPGLGTAKVCDLISKRMVTEGFLVKTQGAYAQGPRAVLSRSSEAANTFRGELEG